MVASKKTMDESKQILAEIREMGSEVECLNKPANIERRNTDHPNLTTGPLFVIVGEAVRPIRNVD